MKKSQLEKNFQLGMLHQLVEELLSSSFFEDGSCVAARQPCAARNLRGGVQGNYLP